MGDAFREHLVKLNREAKDLQADFLRLKEEASDAKKRWEAKVTEIQAAIDEDFPLFDGRDDGGGGGWGGGGGGGGPDGPTTPPPGGGGEPIDVEFVEIRNPQLPAPTVIADPRAPVPAAFRDESWRSVSLDALSDHGLSDKLIERMAESGLKTIGDLANFTNGGGRLIDIAGIGESRADEIESAMDEFWAAWRAKDVPKSGGDLVTSRPGAWVEEVAEEKPKRSRKKKAS